MTTLKYTTVFILISILFSACEETTNSPNEIAVDELTGFVQKGPYINGTAVQIFELTENMAQTGKSFSSQIIDNKGTFEIRSLKLSSNYVELQANGFYYNEVSGDNSAAQLTLYALSDISGKNNLNVNVLSHLEKPRVSYLVSEGMAFEEAKKQAQKEILSIFEIDKDDIAASEQLDISKEGEDNAILLAISAIVQGYRNVAELSELLANMITDIREDGTLDSEEIGNALINHVSVMNVADVRLHMQARYSEMGVEANIPNFEKYVQQFIENTDFEITGLVTYPEFSEYGENILYDDKNTFQAANDYSMAADIPMGGSLKVVLSGGMWGYIATGPNAPINWKVSEYDFDQNQQSFTTLESDKRCDLKIRFDRTQPQDSIMMYYYINGAEFPNKTKILYIDGSNTVVDTMEVN
jgi:hypothetical protein